jgi:hypothetical protein
MRKGEFYSFIFSFSISEPDRLHLGREKREMDA